MLDLNLIRSFVTVCETGSVTVAAKALKQPKSTISRHLGRLEEELGEALLDRSRSGVALTSEGKRLFEQTRESIHLLEPLGRKPAGPAKAGHVRIRGPRYFVRGPLSRVVRAFMIDNPEVTIECLSDNRLAVAPEAETDVVVSVGAALEGGHDVWPLGRVAARLYASPALFADGVVPGEPADLSDLPLLSSCGTIGIPERLSLASGRGKAVTIAPRTRLITNELDILLEAACDGLGLVVLPEFVGADEVAAGRLVAVLPDCAAEDFQVAIALLSGRRNATARRFVDFALRQSRA